MTKEQMQATINTQAKQLSQARGEIRDLQFLKETEVKNAKSIVENEFYEQWKQLNGKFMKRYIKELISNGELSFGFESDYDGYFTMEVYMDKTVLTTVNGEICMSHDSLDE